MIFELGEYVRVRSDRADHWNNRGLMDRYCGRVVKIIGRESYRYHILRDSEDVEKNDFDWSFYETDFIPLDYNCIFSNR